MNLFRRKSVADMQAEALADTSLKRALGPVNLTAFGIGAIIGTGIFVLTGTVAAQNAGPAVVLSFVLAGIASVFAALCYSEFASLVPMSGSAYTYGYTTLGEFFAWVIGWDLILEYAVGAITVSIGWSGYVVSFLRDIGLQVPPQLSAARGTQLIEIPGALAPLLHLKAGWQVVSAELTRQIAANGADAAALGHATAIFNLPAILIVFIVTTLLVIGIKESARFNNAIVFVKLAVIVLFLIGAAKAVTVANWHPFIPANTGESGHFGWTGVMTGAGIVFFAYIGFDAVSTAAQEAKNPQRDLPIGIIGSLLICTAFYILVSAVATGVVPYRQLDVPDPIALAADRAGLGWMASFIKLGAIAGLSSVDTRHALRSIACVLCDVAGRIVAAVRASSASAIPHAVVDFDFYRRVGFAFCRGVHCPRGGKPLFDWHVARVRDCIRRNFGFARAPSGVEAAIPHTRRVVRGADGRSLGALPDGIAAVANVETADRLVRHRHGGLFRLRD